MVATRLNPTNKGIENISTKSNQVISIDPTKPNPPVRGIGIECMDRLFGTSIILSELLHLINRNIIKKAMRKAITGAANS